MYEKRVNVQLLRLRVAFHTSPLLISIYARKASLSLRPYARKNYATVEIHLKKNFTCLKMIFTFLFCVVWDYSNSKQNNKQCKQKTSPQSYTPSQIKILDYPRESGLKQPDRDDFKIILVYRKIATLKKPCTLIHLWYIRLDSVDNMEGWTYFVRQILKEPAACFYIAINEQFWVKIKTSVLVTKITVTEDENFPTGALQPGWMGRNFFDKIVFQLQKYTK